MVNDMDYRNVFHDILKHFETTEEYARYLALGLDKMDIYLDPSYPGYSEGILAIKNLSSNAVYSRYEIYGNIRLLQSKLLEGIMYSNLIHLYIIDYTGYTKDDYLIFEDNCEFLGDVPDGLRLHCRKSSLDFSVLDKLYRQNIKLYPSFLHSIRVTIDSNSDIFYIVMVVYNLFLNFMTHFVSSRVSIEVTFSGGDADRLYNLLVSELYSAYKKCSADDKETFSLLFKYSKIELNFSSLMKDGFSYLYQPAGLSTNIVLLDSIVHRKN
jgi:hypothetical protein